MLKKNCTVVGIEVRKSVDPQTKIASQKYYLHCTSTSGDFVEGNLSAFSARLPDDLVHSVEVGCCCDIVYRSYNGWNTVEGLYYV